MRPKPIQLFERLYLASILLSVISGIIGWDALVRRAVASSPETVGIAPILVGVVIGFVALIQLVIWYFVARSGSSVAKWAAVVFLIFNLWTVPTILQGVLQGSLPAVITTFARIVELAAIVMLFRADAKPWFAYDDEEDEAPVA